MATRSKEDLEFQGNVLLGLICLGLLFGLGRCAYSIGYPYTCDDAHAAIRDAEYRLDEAYEKGQTGANRTAASDLAKAKRATQEKCPAGRMEF